MSNENDPVTQPADDESSPMEMDAPETQQAPADDPAVPLESVPLESVPLESVPLESVPLESVPLIKVDAASAASRGRGKAAGPRRDKGADEPLPDFTHLESSADDPEQTPDPANITAPAVDVRTTPTGSARNRSGQRRAARDPRPAKIDFGSRPPSSPEAGTCEEDTESEASQTRSDSQPARQRPEPQLPTTPRSVTAKRRTASPKSKAIVVAVCGVSAVGVVILLVFLLGGRPAGSSTSAEAEAARPSSGSTAPRSASPSHRSGERSGVRGYNKAEAAQRRQGIDSFAEMGRSQETQLHRGEWVAPPAQPGLGRGGPVAEPPADITKGLLAHWSFETKSHDQAADDSSHEHPASLDGKPASTATGALGLALRLDGKDDCLRVPDGLLKGAAGTLSLWLRTRDRAEPKVLVSSAEPPAVFSLRLQAGQLVAGAAQAGSESMAVPVPRWSTTWQHLAVTWQSGGQVTLYLDGLPLGQRPAGPLPDPTGVEIGRDAVDGTCSAVDVDEVRLFDRAVSDREVAELAARE